MDGSSYMNMSLSGKFLKRKAQKVIETIRKHFPNCQAIAFRGISGALMAPVVAAELGLPLILVRKSTDSCHSNAKVEGCSRKEVKYVIIDDFIESGNTIETTIYAIEQDMACPVCLGAILYKGKSNGNSVTEYVFERLQEAYNIELIML